MKKLILFFGLLLLLAIWYGESRKFFCIGDGECVTVWNTYVIPGRYYGVVKPAELPKALIVQCFDGVKIKNDDAGSFAIYRFEADTARFLNLLYMPNARKRSEMKPGAGLMDIDIHESSAIDKDGKGL